MESFLKPKEGKASLMLQFQVPINLTDSRSFQGLEIHRGDAQVSVPTLCGSPQGSGLTSDHRVFSLEPTVQMGFEQ